MNLDYKESYNLETFKLAIENAFDHIVITDSDGKILFANKAVERITGFKREEIIGNKPSLWGRLMGKKFYEKLWRTIKKNKKTFVGEITNKRKNGELYTAEIRISPIFDERGNVIFFVGIERDITKAKEIDKAKSEFVSLTSHQLKNPLTTINGYIEMLLKKSNNISEEKQYTYLTEIQVATKKMVNLINLLLNVSKIELGIFSAKSLEINLKGVIHDELMSIRARIEEKKIKVIEKYNNNKLVVKGDMDLLRIIFQNLITNAVKYTPSKGKIVIEGSKGKKDEILIKISDTGYGIPKDQHKKIFIKLFRGRNVQSIDGIGLGLYTVKTVIDKMRGKIWFESEENKGTTFYIQLPSSKK